MPWSRFGDQRGERRASSSFKNLEVTALLPRKGSKKQLLLFPTKGKTSQNQAHIMAVNTASQLLSWAMFLPSRSGQGS